MEQNKNNVPDYNKMIERATISFGKIDARGTGRKANEVELTIEWQQDHKGRPVLSVTCGVWNSRKTDYEMCGQCLDCVQPHEKTELWNEIKELWEKWHCNDAKAGAPEQYELIMNHFGRRMDYTAECDYLKSIGKYEVKYGMRNVTWGKEFIYWEIPKKDQKRILEIIRKGK